MFDDKLVKKIWKEKSNGFTVEVVHWKDMDYICIENHFNVYAYIYKNHPLFNEIDENGTIYQMAFDEMPLHCGASFFKVHRNEKGDITSYQVGSDYNHLYDDYKWCNDINETPVKYDGERLFNYLKSFEK